MTLWDKFIGWLKCLSDLHDFDESLSCDDQKCRRCGATFWDTLCHY